MTSAALPFSSFAIAAAVVVKHAVGEDHVRNIQVSARAVSAGIPNSIGDLIGTEAKIVVSRKNYVGGRQVRNGRELHAVATKATASQTSNDVLEGVGRTGSSVVLSCVCSSIGSIDQ